MPVLTETMVMVTHIVLELGFSVAGASATHGALGIAAEVRTETPAPGFILGVGSGLARGRVQVLSARLARMKQLVAVDVEL